MRGLWRTPLLALLAAGLLIPATASAAKTCPEPGDGDFPRATPAEAGLDAAKIQAAMDYGTSQAGLAVRVYRDGCLVAEDRGAPGNRTQTYESYSMAKSVTGLMFGAAMEDGFISPDDPVGSLVPQADANHGAIKAEHLLEMTSGLKWNGARDYNVFTPFDRVRDTLTLDFAHPPGTYYEYAQSPVTMAAHLVQRATGMDAQAYFQQEVADPLGIAKDRWTWSRDGGGNTYGFWGVNMRPDDYGRLGELMRRGGVWKGKRLLSEEFMRESLRPGANNPCYGWLIWVNAGEKCVGPTVTERPTRNNRRFPGLPKDQYTFSGLFGQIVAVFPTQKITIVRTGQDPGLVPTGGTSWEHELYRQVLSSITDGPSGIFKEATGTSDDADYGFQTAFRNPGEYDEAANPTPLAAAGPQRARAAHLSLALPKPSKRGNVALRLTCPPLAGTGRCTGVSWLETSRGGGKRYDVPAGGTTVLRFKLSKLRLGQLRRDGRAAIEFIATNEDAAQGTQVKRRFTVENGPKAKKKKRSKRRR